MPDKNQKYYFFVNKEQARWLGLAFLAAFAVGAIRLALEVFGTAGPFANSILDLITVLGIGVCSSFLFIYIQRSRDADELREEKEKQRQAHHNVIEWATILQESRQKFGYAGIFEKPLEVEKIQEFSSKEMDERNPPEICCMNFKIHNSQDFQDVLVPYLKAGGKFRLIVYNFTGPAVEARRKEINYGRRELGDEGSRDPDGDSTPLFSEPQLYANDMLNRSVGWVNFLTTSAAYKGSFEVRFANQNLGTPLFLIQDRRHFEAWSGYYLLERSRKFPYIRWETGGEMVEDLQRYFEYQWQNAMSVDDFMSQPQVQEIANSK